MPATHLRALRRAARLLLAIGGICALGGCVGVLDPVGPVGRDDAQILIDAVLIMLGIVVPTLLLAFWMAVVTVQAVAARKGGRMVEAPVAGAD